ncbi:Tim44 domain-containing protein [Massilia forsythiae]|uniref:Tim44 domain-containing protein n=1 Tax=Massilia forsythiae TaxID=2728020 RepID=A0A7Z2VUN4_9BURK|nr:Tim44-like domain-containing protein [Massilia forsythiae]QJD99596.1 Tim44 domain-containing protein [Massilia forsythiae]
MKKTLAAKKLLATSMIALTMFSTVAEAFARPVGGGRSIGRQSQAVRQMRTPAPAPTPSYQQQQRQAPQPAPVPARAPAPQRSGMWKGILGGALLGLGLGALFSHLGIGGAMASALSTILMLVLLALAVMFIVRMFRRKSAPASGAFNRDPLPAGAAPGFGSAQPDTAPPSAYQGGYMQPTSNVSLDKGGQRAHQQWGVPADFDAESFLRHAKASFIRMQAAWDRSDLADLREFTSPEVYAELSLQIQERGGNPDFTEVVSIDAQLLGIETTERDYLASVQFNGMIRNAQNAPAEPFVEVWNLSKPLQGQGGWVLAGIQQIT